MIDELFIEQLLNDPIQIGVVVLGLIFFLLLFILMIIRIQRQKIHKPQTPPPPRYNIAPPPRSRKRRISPVPIQRREITQQNSRDIPPQNIDED